MMLRTGPAARKTPTIRVPMLAVALIAIALGLFVNERWRWGNPRQVPIDRETALSWISKVCRSDYRMYNGPDIWSLMNLIVREKLLIGKSSEEIAGLLGPALRRLPASLTPDPDVVYFRVGIVPESWRTERAMLRCRIDDAGKCVEVKPLGSN